MYNEKEADQLWNMIPEDSDVVVTHGPPYGIQDLTTSNHHAGCKSLLDRMLKIKPKLHIFGHIHEAYGTTEKDGVIFHNASAANFAYKITNKATVFEVEVKA